MHALTTRIVVRGNGAAISVCRSEGWGSKSVGAMRPTGRATAGVTLLELLVVLVILGVLVSVAGFSLTAAPTSRADDAGSAALERALRAGAPALDSTAGREQQLYLPNDPQMTPIQGDVADCWAACGRPLRKGVDQWLSPRLAHGSSPVAGTRGGGLRS